MFCSIWFFRPLLSTCSGPLGQASSSSLEAPTIRFVPVRGAAGIQRQIRCSIYPPECSQAMGEAIIKQVNTVICAAQPGRELSQTWRGSRASRGGAVVLSGPGHATAAALSACGLTREASTGSQKRHTWHVEQDHSS